MKIMQNNEEEKKQSLKSDDVLADVYKFQEQNKEAQDNFDSLNLRDEEDDDDDKWQESVMFKEEQLEEFKMDSGIDVSQDLVVDNPKSVYVIAHQKIDIESIYDNQPTKQSKTRFSNLPTNVQKVNRPVTFQKKIKSSGYSVAPKEMKYLSQEQKKKAQQKNVDGKSSGRWTLSQDFYSKSLPMSIQPDVEVYSSKQVSKSSVKIVQYSPYGTKLAYGCYDNMIGVIKTPVYENKMDFTALNLHNGTINSLHWNSTDNYLLSASADKSCIMWNLTPTRKGEKLMILNRQKMARQGEAFKDDIKQAQFYYQDKLIALCAGNKLNFYQYQLPKDDQIQDDVKRLQQRGTYKLV